MIVRLIEVGSDGNLTVTPEALMIKDFKNVWDKYKDKKKSLEELSYIYWMAYYNSVYDVYLSIEEKKEAIKGDVITDPNWKPDARTENAILKFTELQRTFSMAFLESAKMGAIKIRKYFEDVDLTERNRAGSPVYKPVDITNAITKSIDVLESLEKWSERVKKEEELTDSKIKGGGRAGIFEDESTATWLKDE
jgi:hypothetical protein